MVETTSIPKIRKKSRGPKIIYEQTKRHVPQPFICVHPQPLQKPIRLVSGGPNTITCKTKSCFPHLSCVCVCRLHSALTHASLLGFGSFKPEASWDPPSPKNHHKVTLEEAKRHVLLNLPNATESIHAPPVSCIYCACLSLHSTPLVLVNLDHFPTSAHHFLQ